MSSLRVNILTNIADNGPVEFTNGITVPSNIDLDVDKVIVNSSSGILTATSFKGVGSGITTFGVVDECETGRAIAYTIIG